MKKTINQINIYALKTAQQATIKDLYQNLTDSEIEIFRNNLIIFWGEFFDDKVKVIFDFEEDAEREFAESLQYPFL